MASAGGTRILEAGRRESCVLVGGGEAKLAVVPSRLFLLAVCIPARPVQLLISEF